MAKFVVSGASKALEINAADEAEARHKFMVAVYGDVSDAIVPRGYEGNGKLERYKGRGLQVREVL